MGSTGLTPTTLQPQLHCVAFILHLRFDQGINESLSLYAMTSLYLPSSKTSLQSALILSHTACQLLSSWILSHFTSFFSHFAKQLSGTPPRAGPSKHFFFQTGIQFSSLYPGWSRNSRKSSSPSPRHFSHNFIEY